MKSHSIESGTVIDHIPAGAALKIFPLLALEGCHTPVTIDLNLPSGRMGRKDVIRISNAELSAAVANRIALLAPYATVSLIQDHAVVSKFRVESPDQIEGLVICPNLRCITRQEPVRSSFQLLRRQEERSLRCCYCNRTFSQSEVVIAHD